MRDTYTNLNSTSTTSWYNLHAYAFFFIIALLAMLFSFHRGVLISGDMGIYITLANALSFPELFENSAAYANITSYGLMPYTMTPSLIRASILLFGTYSYAIHLLSFFNAFFLMAGFYAFSTLYCKDKWTAFLNTLLLLVPIRIGWATFWGLNTLTKPRETFLCFFIWILFFAFKVRNRHDYWPLVMFFQGLLVLVHPISAVGAALGIWTGLIPFLPSRWSGTKQIGWMFLCGFCFLISASPAGLSLFCLETSTIPYSIWLESWSVRTIWLSFYQELGYFIFQFCVRIPILPIGLMLGIWIWKKGNMLQRDLLKMITGFTVGIAAMVFMYFAYHHLFAEIKKIPPQTQLIRAMKFIVFSSLIVMSVGLISILKDHKHVYYAIIVTLIAGIGTSGNLPDVLNRLYEGAKYPLQKNLTLPAQNKDYMQLVEFAKTTPPHTSFMGNADLLPLRNLALRPLAYSFKDGSSLLLIKHHSLKSWFTAAQHLNSNPPSPEPLPDFSNFFPALSSRFIAIFQKLRSKLNSEHSSMENNLATQKQANPGLDIWVREALRVGADYLVIEKSKKPINKKIVSQILVWENNSFLVLKVIENSEGNS